MSRKRQRNSQERRLIQAREADQTLRRERASSLHRRACRVRKVRGQIGWTWYRLGIVTVVVKPWPRLFEWGLGVSAGFLVLYLLLGLYRRRLERERDFYGWVPDPRVIPPDWKRM